MRTSALLGSAKRVRAEMWGFYDLFSEAEERAEEVDELMGRLGEHGVRAEKVKAKSPDLFRAMGNLATVLKNRARAGKLDQKAIDEIVDIIDEVAKRIERM